MKKILNTLLLSLVFTFVLASRQSTPAIASSKHTTRAQINAARTRIIQATEILDDQFTKNIARNNYNEAQMKRFIVKKVKASLPEHYQSRSQKISETIISQSNLYSMDPLFIVALIENESKFNPKALGQFGEQGLMQIKPSTATWIAKKYHLATGKQYSLYNPTHNIKFGVAYLDYLRQKYHRSGKFYIEAYNLGPQRMNDFMKRHETRITYHHLVRNHYLALYAQIEQSNADDKTVSERYPRIARVKARVKAGIKRLFWA